MLTRRVFVTALSLAATAAAGAAVPATAAATTPGAQAWRVQGATDLGALPSRPMAITLALAPRHAAQLKALATSRHAALTPKQFNARFAPATVTVKAIRTWARAHRLKVSDVAANRMLVRITGQSAQIGRALHTSFELYGSPATGRFFQIARAAQLPRAFASGVSAVMGLSSLARFATPVPAQRSAADADKALATAAGLVPTLGLNAPTLSYPAAYTPQDFWSMYDAPSGQTGAGQHLAIITEGDVSQPEADLKTFETTYNLPTKVTWNQINVGTPSSDTSGDDEWDLDSQYSTAFAPGVGTLDVYVGPSLSDQDIVATIDRWVSDNASRQGSFSAGECELLAYAGGMTAALDPVLEQAAAQGRTMFFSSGDTGAFCPAIVGLNGVPLGLPGTNYPASSPYGIGVGGTSVLSPSGPFEIAWYAGGGGSSLFEPTPSYQASTTVGGAAPLVQRGVPDVSLDADPASGYDVVVNGTVQVIGGTSASAPSWQGIWARAQGAKSAPLGFAGPVIYGTEPASAFHDITLGSNGFPAMPGWDYATGRGTPDMTSFVNGA